MSPRSWRRTTRRGTTATVATRRCAAALMAASPTRRRGAAARCRGASAARARASAGTRACAPWSARPRRGRGAGARPSRTRSWPRSRASRRAERLRRSRGAAPEPVADGHAEAGLAARRDLGRQVVGKGSPQRELAAPTLELERVGSETPSSSTSQSRSGERSSSECAIDAMSALSEQVAREIGCDVEQLETGDPGRGGGPSSCHAGAGER